MGGRRHGARARVALGLAAATVVTGLGAVQVSTATPAAAATTTVAAALPANPGIQAIGPFAVLNTQSGLGAPATGRLAAGASLDLTLTGFATTGSSVVLSVRLTGAVSGGSLTVYPTGAAKPLGTLNFSTGASVSGQVIVQVGTANKVRFTNGGGAVNVAADVTGVIPGPFQQYTALTPARLLDTRSGLGTVAAGQVGPGGTVDLAVAGRGGVPATGAASVVLNVIGLAPTVATTLTAWPSGAARANTTTLAIGAGVNRTAMVVLPLGTGGRVSLRNAAGSVHLLADVSGWFSADGSYVPRNPFRLADTRTGLGIGGVARKLGAQQNLALNLSAVPGSAVGSKRAALVVVTAIRPTVATFLTVTPTGFAGVPTVSSLTAPAAAVTTNVAVVAMNGVGFNDFFVYNFAGSTDVTVDVLGWVSQPLTVIPPLFPEAAVGVPYRQQLTSGSGEGDLRTWSAANTLPPGFSISAAGVISGTPTAAGTLSIPARVTDASGATAFSVISLPVSAVGSSALWGWGTNSSYMLGVDPALLSRTITPAQVHETGATLQAASGQGTSYALGADGTVWGWGLNQSGQAGQPSTTPVVIRPARIAGLTGVTAIAAGGSNGYALKADGTVWAWGAGGRLGNGTTVGSSTPVRVTGLTGVTAIASAPLSSVAYALKADGTVWSWGGGGLLAPLGTGATQSLVPAQLPGLTGITSIGAGALNGFAVDAVGGLHAWGTNSSGQIGDGTTTPRTTPVPVPGLTGVTSATGYVNTSYARTSDGSVWAWGGGTSGQLGNGTATSSLVPVKVPGLTGVTEVVAGLNDAAALTADGGVWLWGALAQSYTALGTPGARLSPERATLLPPVAHLGRSQAGYFALGRP